MDESEYVAERCAVLATAVGIARLRLTQGRVWEATVALDEGAARTRQLLREYLVELTGKSESEIEQFLGVTA